MRQLPLRFVSAALILLPPSASADTRPMPSETTPGLHRVEVLVSAAPTASWELGWALAHPNAGEVTFVKRTIWTPLAAAIDATAPAELATVYHFDEGEVLIQVTTRNDGSRVVTLLLPEGLLRPHTGKFTLGLETTFSRVRTSTTEITTWPLAVSLEAWEEPQPNRRLEGSVRLGRELTERRTRESVRDASGELVSFRDLSAETLRDARLATARAGWFATMGRDHHRRELGVTIEAVWEEDQADLVESRLVALAGLEWRRTSEEIDGQVFRGAFKLGTTRSEYLVPNDEEGASPAIERHDLPVWQVELGASSPLWQVAGVPVLSGELGLSWQQSLERSGGSEDRPAKLESLGSFDLGLVAHTPIGVEIGFAVHLEYRDLPGEAGQRIDDLSWSTGARSTLRLAF
jgi:hypothetical protein